MLIKGEGKSKQAHVLQKKDFKMNHNFRKKIHYYISLQNYMDISLQKYELLSPSSVCRQPPVRYQKEEH